MWFNVKIQRCLFHVWMIVTQKLTLNPETQASQELLNLSRELLKIKSIEHANNWQSKFKIWKKKYYEFISQKSVNPETGEIWFTHARLRLATFNLGKLILNKTLFNFLDNCKVKSMNNVLEGGINSPIRRLLNCHRDTNFTSQQKIVEIYLLKRSMFWNKISMLLNSENQLFCNITQNFFIFFGFYPIIYIYIRKSNYPKKLKLFFQLLLRLLQVQQQQLYWHHVHQQKKAISLTQADMIKNMALMM